MYSDSDIFGKICELLLHLCQSWLHPRPIYRRWKFVIFPSFLRLRRLGIFPSEDDLIESQNWKISCFWRLLFVVSKNEIHTIYIHGVLGAFQESEIFVNEDKIQFGQVIYQERWKTWIQQNTCGAWINIHERRSASPLKWILVENHED